MDRFAIRLGPYRPKPRKRQRRQRGVAKSKSRRRYRQNPGLNRLHSRMRYNHHKKNPRFKRKQMIRRKNPQRFRRLGSVEEREPRVWFMLPEGDDYRSGYVSGIWAEDWLIDIVLEDGKHHQMDVEEFLEKALMEDEEDIDQLFDILDEASQIEDNGEETGTYYGIDPDTPIEEMSIGDVHAEDASFEKIASRVARRYLHGFNKESPSELLSQLLRVLDKAAGQSAGRGRKGLQDASSRVKGITRVVSTAWSNRKEE